MAAFRFFRRWQKLVLIIMVLLMVAFLVPTAFRGRGGDDHLGDAIGYIDGEKITLRTRQAAVADLDLLQRSLWLGFAPPPGRMGERTFVQFLQFNRNQDPALTWALLLHEARGMGITVSEDQIEAFLAASGLVGEAYRREVANLHRRQYTEKHLRRAVANYLTVMTAFTAAVVNTPPSLPELRHVFRDLEEQIQLVMVTFEAEEFTAEMPDPSDEAIANWFEKYKHLARGSTPNSTDLGFGYRRPNRMDIAWLFADTDAVARAVEPSEQQMDIYWSKNKGKLKKKVPIRLRQGFGGQVPTTSTAPADSAATQPTQPDTQPTQPVEPKFREVVIEKYSEAKPLIRRILKPQVVQIKMNELISTARKAIANSGDAKDAYEAAEKEMVRRADDLLKKPVPELPFRSAPLETLIQYVGKNVGVKIVYPFGEHDKFFLDPKIEIRLKDNRKIKPGMSLGAFLAAVGDSAKCPEITWVTCRGLENVLFPAEPINLVPVSAGRTGLVGLGEILSHELLGRAGLSEGPAAPGAERQSLLSIAVTAKVFGGLGGRRRKPMINIGDDFDQAMYVSGARRGRLLWRLAGAETSHTPQQLDGDIRKQVIKDIKIADGFKKALAAAEAMKAEADKKGGDLEKIAKDKKRQASKTELFSRKTRWTGDVSWSYVPDVGQEKEFIKKVFTLVPADPDGPHTDRPTAVAPLYRRHKVILVQRIGYEPVTTATFNDTGADTARAVLLIQRWRRMVPAWFVGESVARRVGYRPRS